MLEPPVRFATGGPVGFDDGARIRSSTRQSSRGGDLYVTINTQTIDERTIHSKIISAIRDVEKRSR